MGDADVTASSWKLVEVGRVALFSAGTYAGKLAAIVQIIDHKRVRQIHLSRFKIAHNMPTTGNSRANILCNRSS